MKVLKVGCETVEITCNKCNSILRITKYDTYSKMETDYENCGYKYKNFVDCPVCKNSIQNKRVDYIVK